MKALLLCAGYGTRLAKDLSEERNKARFGHLTGVPKPLLPVAGKPLISHWIGVLREAGIGQIFVIVNDFYSARFEEWKRNVETGDAKITLINDGSKSNETRIGAVGCIDLAVGVDPDTHWLIIAGDTLFRKKDFHILRFIETFKERSANNEVASLIVHTECSEEEVPKRGILELDATGKVTSFREKPSPEETTSRMQSPCFYLLHKDHVGLTKQFLAERQNEPLSERDATGKFIKFLVDARSATIYSYHIEKRFDVGGLQTYLECLNEFDEV